MAEEPKQSRGTTRPLPADDDEDNELAGGSKKRVKKEEDKERAALARSQEFLRSLKLNEEDDTAFAPIVAGDVWCLENVATVTARVTTTENIVLTKEVKEFWAYCVESAEMHHICAKGTPGIGKSTAFVYLIRSLLKMGKRVIYLYRTNKKCGKFYYVWKMGSPTRVFPENRNLEELVDEFDDSNTYYLCDAGKTQDSCDPDLGDSALKVIINASADDKHWGGNEFTKRRDAGIKYGRLLTFPMMSKKQIFVARDKFRNSTTIGEDTLEQRHRKFGAIPRYLFALSDAELEEQERKQDVDLGLLSAEKVKQVLEKTSDLNGNNTSAPRSSIMCITGKSPHYLHESSFVSDLVEEKVATRHMQDLWNEIGAEEVSSTRGHLFESYVRSMFARKSTSSEYTCRNAVGKSNPYYKRFLQFELGKCTEIRRTRNMIQDCKSGPNGIIFYSFNEREPLVDFMYKRAQVYYAIQVTIGKHHKCEEEKLDGFLKELDLQEGQELNLVYAVPSMTFGDFTTSPVEPELSLNFAKKCYILHAEIPKGSS